MRFRLRAFGLHASASFTLLALIFGSLYAGWYRWPGWFLSGVLRVVLIVALVDLVLGPTLTLIVANPGKPRPALARDIAVIVAVQLVALLYGAATLWLGRPLYYTFSVDRLQIVQASDLDRADAERARQQDLALAPHWYTRPRWVWAPLPENAAEAAKIVQSTLVGGPDVIQMPSRFRPWEQAPLRDHFQRVDEAQQLTAGERLRLRQRMSELGLQSDQPNSMLLWGDVRRVLVVFDPRTLGIRAILKP
jgi:hypothetical protein